MKPSSSSSFSSPPLFTTTSRPQSQSSKRDTPSIIPLDYNYQVMAPSSLRPQTGRFSHQIHHIPSRSTTRQSSNADVDVDMEMDDDPAFGSLFGDPIPPPPPQDFLGSTFSTPAFMRSTSADLTSEDDQIMGQTITVEQSRHPQRLFSQVPYTTLVRRYSNASSPSPRNFEILPSSIPRLKPPDIQILPNSSGESSGAADNSPNYMLLGPDDILNKPTIYDKTEAEDIIELKETYTISDGRSLREFSEATTKRRASINLEDQNGLERRTPSAPKDSSPELANMPRQFSNESYSSGEWFRTASMEYPEFSKMPKLRPSSKNVMSIKREEMPLSSPVAAMINDSNGSSSGEERLMGSTQILDQPTVSLDSLRAPDRPPSPSPSCLRSLGETIVLSPREYIKQRRKSIYIPQQSESIDAELDELGEPPIPPPPIPPQPHMVTQDNVQPQTPIRRERSPVILKDSVTTGGDYRVDQTRLHKKTSFTILNEKASQAAQAQSPRYQRSREHTTPSLIPSRPLPKPRHHLQRKSLSSTQLKLPHLMPPVSEIPNEDSPRPSVQFDMTGRYSPSKLPPQKGILHQRESLTSSQDTLPPQAMMRRPSALPSAMDDMKSQQHMKSCETLPIITDPYRTAIPRLNRSELDLRPEEAVFPPGALPRPLKPNPNPTRKQKGLLRVLNHEEILARIPQKSNWSSMDDLASAPGEKILLSPLHELKTRRRSSSTSPSRRSSTLTTSDRRSSNLSSVTTSDFSFRRPSVAGKPKTPQTPRRKSVFQLPSPKVRRKSSSGSSISNVIGRPTRTKIAKPTTLSPIIGTPNRDSSSTQSPSHVMRPIAPGSDSMSDTTSRRDSLSKIPVRSQANSRSNSRIDSHVESRGPSRSGSPMKDSIIAERALQMAGIRSDSRTSQHAVSQPGSRATSRAESRTASRAESRAGSRSTSRASQHATSQPGSRAASRADSRGASRAGSRAASRSESRAPSRSTSRASTKPISLHGSRPTSRMDQAKEIANSRSNSRLSMHSTRRGGSVSPQIGRKTPTYSQTGRRKSISLSPPRGTSRKTVTRRGSISPQAAKAKGRSRSRSKSRTSPERFNSRSRIPVSHKNEKGPVKPTALRKAATDTNLRKTSALKDKAKTPSKQPASAKKLPTSVRKPDTSVRRSTSSVTKSGATTKKDIAKKPPIPTTSRREASNVSKKPMAGGALVKKSASSVDMKNKPQNAKAAAAAKKDAAETSAGKKAAGKPTQALTKSDTSSSLKVPKSHAAAIAGVKKMGDITSATALAAGAAADVATLSALKRQPSSMSLMRVSSKISLLGKKRSESNLSKSNLDLVVPELEPGDKRASSPTKLTTDSALGAAEGAAILEKSQKTLENIQKTVTEATDEIHKTINENLTDLKSFEQDMGLTSDSGASPTPSVTTVVEKKPGAKVGDSISRLGTAEGAANGKSPGVPSQKSPLPPTQPIEASVSVLNADGTQATTSALSNGSSHLNAAAATAASAAAERVSERAISVMPEVDCDSANFQNNDVIADAEGKVTSAMDSGAMGLMEKPTSGSTEDFESEAKRRSPDGQGGSHSGSGKGSGSQEYLENKSLEHEDDAPKGCCRCCAKFCMPCRRSRCSRCCQRKRSDKHDEAKQPVLSASSSATTTHLEVVDEKDHGKKTSCWQKLNCCKSCRKKEHSGITEPTAAKKEQIKEEKSMPKPMGPPKQSRCGLCLSKIFCCRSVNKIDPKTGDETEVKKCCFCIPCRKKRGSSTGASMSGSTVAWQDPEAGITATDAAVLEGQDVPEKQGCCKRFCNFLLCCRKKKIQVADSRRQSIKAAPPEDNRRKLHVDLVEYSSKMKGAIPVLPLCLAWFCALCNVLIPGLGTLLSGFLCICLGIPRFSHYDSAKARFGSFLINVIVAISQLFCVLFCLVGWGWSIWWGTIMIKCARKLSKIRKVERLEMEEEKRQAAAEAAAAEAKAETGETAKT